MLDFNETKNTSRQLAPAVDVRDALLERIESTLAYLFPLGRIIKGEFEVGDLYGNAGHSLKVGISGVKTGLWHDFATGEGGDILGLWAGCHRLDVKNEFLAVIRSACAWLGIDSNAQRPCPKPRETRYDDLGAYTGKWDYLDANGRLIACVYRYDTPQGKQYRPWDVAARKHCAPNPRPLYNLPGIAGTPYVVLVEGEKAADALIAQGITATTAMFGANASPDKTDWAPLTGKHLVIWPDNDEPGKIYAETVRVFLGITENILSLEILKIPEGKPKGWDAADAVIDDMDFLVKSCVF